MTWTRRNFLRTLGFGAGATLLSPFFGQLARAQATGSHPRRFVIVVEGNCVEPTTLTSANARAAIAAATSADLTGRRWFSRQYGHDTMLTVDPGDLTTASALDPLAAGPSGEIALDDHAMVVLGLSSKVTGGGHTTHCGALSCTRSTATSPGGETIDAWLARQPEVRADTPFDALRLGITAGNSRLVYSTCAHGAGRPAAIVTDPTIAFNQVFGSVASAAGKATFNQRSELLDFAHEDVTRALSEFSGSSDERAKLEQYLTSLEAISVRQQQLVDMEATLEQVKPDDPTVSPLYASSDPLDWLRAQFEIATAALQGGLTNVVTIASGTGYGFGVTYPSLTSDQVDRHDIHHGSAGNAEYLGVIHEATRQHVAMIARMARTLAATPEPGTNGSMLDHTVILYMSDNGEQHHSTAEEWPVLLVGGRALGFQSAGQTLVYPREGHANNRQVSNLFNTLGFAAGYELVDFGNEASTRIAEGELSDVWQW